MLDNNFLIYKTHKINIPIDVKLIHKVIFKKTEVCILDNDFLFILDLKSNLKAKIKLPENLSINQNYKYDFIVDKLENCWLSIQNKGLFILKNNIWVSVNESLELNPEENINFLFCDSSGKLWIATNTKGLFCIPSTLIEILTIQNTDNYFTSFANSNHEDTLFFATKFSLYSISKDNKIKFLKKSESEISLDNFQKKPILFSNSSLPFFSEKKSNILSLKGIQIIEKNNDNFVTLAKNNSIIDTKPDKSTIQITNKVFKKEKIKSVIKHKNEYYFNNGQEINIRNIKDDFIYEKRKLKFKINDFIEDFAFVNDTMWVASNNKILKILNENIIDSIVEINNTKLSNIQKIKQIDNEVFICAGNGLFKIGEKSSFVANKFNFLPVNDVYNVSKFNNNLFIATNNGLVKINEKYFSTKTKKPNLEIIFNNKPTTKINIESDLQFVTVGLNIQNFFASENQIVQYKVDNSKWIDTKNKTINFQSVSYGNHEIVVRIKDINSDWAVNKFEIYKSYPFYLKWWFIVGAFLLFFAIVLFIYNQQIQKIKTQKQQEIENNNRIIELKQNALSAMMNPHFIFNSLSAAQYFVNSNQPEKSSDHIAKLARLVRLFLSQSGEPFISIADEIKRLKMYVELEQVRFNNFYFDLIVDKNIDLNFSKIPNMIVQPFIENAILHGISSSNVTNGKIECIFSLQKNVLIIEIIDNGFGLDNTKANEINHVSKGIAITNERLNILQKLYPINTFSINQGAAFPDKKRKGHKVIISISLC